MIDRPLYVDKIMAYADTPFVKILTGVRRCGKSTSIEDDYGTVKDRAEYSG
mgnify:CR=1 FL=1